MNLSRNSTESLTLELSEKELLTLRACMRESFALLDRQEFPLRVGIQIDAASKIAAELSSLMQDVGVEE